jgi:hypothetical protein
MQGSTEKGTNPTNASRALVPAGARSVTPGTRPVPATPPGAAEVPEAPGTDGPDGAEPGAVPERSALPRRGELGYRTAVTMLVVGLLLVAVGAGLLAAFYPAVAHAETAEYFLQSTGATTASSNSLSFVYLPSGVSAGDTVVIQDTVDQAVYNASSDTTALTFHSIAELAPTARAPFQSLALGLFATIAGHPGWIGRGPPSS